MAPVRRLIASVLLLALSLPVLLGSLALGQDPESGLPACCRRTGQHHCAMRMGEMAQVVDRDVRFRAPPERCPYCPALATSAHLPLLWSPTPAQAIFAGFLSHPAVMPQAESKRRISRDRSRQKRGPPHGLLS